MSRVCFRKLELSRSGLQIIPVIRSANDNPITNPDVVLARISRHWKKWACALYREQSELSEDNFRVG